MNFKQRFLRYLLGFGIGCLLVFIMFPSRDWLGWSPEKQIMQRIRESKTTLSPLAECKLNCFGMDWTQLQSARNFGAIDFGKSDTKSMPRRYYLLHEDNYFEVLLSDTTCVIDNLGKASSNPSCTCPN